MNVYGSRNLAATTKPSLLCKKPIHLHTSDLRYDSPSLIECRGPFDIETSENGASKRGPTESPTSDDSPRLIESRGPFDIQTSENGASKRGPTESPTSDDSPSLIECRGP